MLISNIHNNSRKEDTKGVIRSRISKRENNITMTNRKRTKTETIVYKTLHRKLKLSTAKDTQKWGKLGLSERVGSISDTRRLRFRLAIMLYVLLRYTDSDYPFGIFKHFLRLRVFILKF